MQWIFYLLVTWYHVTFKNCKISNSMRPINIKFGKIVHSNKRLSFLRSNNLLKFGSRGVTRYLKITLWNVYLILLYDIFYHFVLLFDAFVPWHYLIFKTRYISTSMKPINTKLGKIVHWNTLFVLIFAGSNFRTFVQKSPFARKN